MGFSLRGAAAGGDDPPAVLYCVVPREIADVERSLSRRFGIDPEVEVVVDRRFAERRRGVRAGGDAAAPGGAERRAIDGRRAASMADPQPRLPADLRHLQREVAFHRVDDRGWRRRALAAEQAAVALAKALEAAIGALRSRRGLSPLRFLQVTRAEQSIERYYRWRAGVR